MKRESVKEMQSDEDFNIKFVSIIRRYRCLYDKKVPEYRNKDEQEKSWKSISQETQESVLHCKERWRNLRACLSRYIKQQNTAEAQHKPYYLTEHMHFLLPFLKSHRQSLTGGGSIGDSYAYDYRRNLSLDIKSSDHEETMETDYVENNKFPVMTNDVTRFNDVNCVPEVHVDVDAQDSSAPDVCMIANSDRMETDGKPFKIDPSAFSHYSDEPDMDFFRSIIPDIQAMNAQQKRKFKIGVLELIDEVFTKYPSQRPSFYGGGEMSTFTRINQ